MNMGLAAQSEHRARLGHFREGLSKSAGPRALNELKPHPQRRAATSAPLNMSFRAFVHAPGCQRAATA